MNKNNLVAVVAGVIATIALALLTIIDLKIPRVISAIYIDVSASNAKNKANIQQLCKTYLTHLKEGDTFIEAEFADTTFISKNQAFEERDRLKFQKDCKNAANPPFGVGKNDGTPLLEPLTSLKQEMDKQHKSGNKTRMIAIFVIQDNEPLKNGSSEKIEELTKKVESFTKGGNVVLFIGSDVKLQHELNSALANVSNSKVCTYEDANACLEWAFNSARK